MKRILLLAVFIVGLFASCSQESTETTYYLIRHAEKDRTDKTNKNPNLNKKGLERAKKWAEYFKNIHLDAVYSTDYNRTQQTATPTANSKSLEIISYDPSKMNNTTFQTNTKNKTVLVVGHSNTTPFFANKILSAKKYSEMDDKDNSSLYIVKIIGDNKTSTIVKVN